MGRVLTACLAVAMALGSIGVAEASFKPVRNTVTRVRERRDTRQSEGRAVAPLRATGKLLSALRVGRC